MAILDKILFIVHFVLSKIKAKEQSDKQDKYEQDQNAIKDDPVKWANDHFRVRTSEDRDSNK